MSLPQTERIKAAIVLAEDDLSIDRMTEVIAAIRGLHLFLLSPASGAFYDKMQADGSFIPEPARASSLYHILSAYSELFRFVDQIIGP